MNLRELNYEVELPEASIKPFERKVLESGLCDFAVPMSFTDTMGCKKFAMNAVVILRFRKRIYQIHRMFLRLLKKHYWP